MHYLILTAGKPALAFAKTASSDYLKRLTRHGQYDLRTVRDGSSADVSARLLAASSGCYRIALDERGSTPTTRDLSTHIEKLELRGDIKTIAFLIGAADGHSEELREKADYCLALSTLTLQHELALIVLLEQIYRLASIRVNSPYHRD